MSTLPTPKPGTTILPQHDNMDDIAASAVESVTSTKWQLPVDFDEREGSKRSHQDSQVSPSTPSTVVFRLDPTRACFLDLPGELRNKIYDLVETDEYGHYVHAHISYNPKTKKFINKQFCCQTGMVKYERSLAEKKVWARYKEDSALTQDISALGLTNRVVRGETRTYFYETAFWKIYCTPETDIFPYPRFLELIKADGRSTISNMHIKGLYNPAENPARLASFLRLLSECQNLQFLELHCYQEWFVHKQAFIDYINWAAPLPTINVAQLAEGFPRIEKLERVVFNCYFTCRNLNRLTDVAEERLDVLVHEVRKVLAKALGKHCHNAKVCVSLQNGNRDWRDWEAQMGPVSSPTRYYDDPYWVSISTICCAQVILMHAVVCG